MKNKNFFRKTILTSTLLTLLMVSFGTAYSQCGGGHDHSAGSSTKSVDNSTKGEVIYVCPMHSDVTSKTAGNCPKCGMALEKRIIKSSESVNANTKTETFGVNGNCGMCKKKIEGALTNKKGISSSEWNQETKQLTVTYNPDVIKIEKIHQLVADTGYDTDKIKAPDKAYNKLSGCCQYERK